MEATLPIYPTHTSNPHGRRGRRVGRAGALEADVEVPSGMWLQTALGAFLTLSGVAIALGTGLSLTGAVVGTLTALTGTVVHIGNAIRRRRYAGELDVASDVAGPVVEATLRDAIRERTASVRRRESAQLWTGSVRIGVGVLGIVGLPALTLPGLQAMPDGFFVLGPALGLSFLGLLLWGLQARRTARFERLAERGDDESVAVTTREAMALLADTRATPQVRVAAARYLAAHGDNAAMPTVSGVAEAGGNWAVAYAARAAVQHIIERGHRAPQGGLTVVDRSGEGHLSRPDDVGRLCLESG